MKRTLSVLLIGLLAFSASSAVVEVKDGESADIGQNSSGTNNAMGLQLRFLGDGTLRQVVQDSSFDYIYFWPNFQLWGKDRVVTYDYTPYYEATKKTLSPRISRSISAVKGAALKVKGANSLSIGRSDSSMVVDFPLFDVEDVSFVDAGDQSVSGTILVQGEATIGKFPHKSMSSVTLGNLTGSTRFAFAGANIIGHLVKDNVLDLSTYGSRHVWLLGAAMPTETSLRLGANQHFQFRGASINPETSDEHTWSAVTGGWDRIEFPIALNGGLVEMYGKSTTCTFEGAITGGGSLDMVGAYERIFNRLDGSFAITNTGSFPASVHVKSLAIGSILTWSTARINVTFEEGALDPNAITVTNNGMAYVYNFGYGSVLPARLLPIRDRKISQALTLNDGQRVEGRIAENASKIRVAEGATVTVANAAPTTVRLQPGSGTFVLEHGGVPDYWFDFSKSATMKPGINGYEKSYPDLVECAVDWRRPDDVSFALWNRRAYKTDGSYEFVSSVYGKRVSGKGPDGQFSCLDFESGRIYLSKDEGYNYNGAVPTAFQSAVIVFNSARGGGWGLVGTSNGSLCRSGTTLQHGLTTNTTHRIWVDGEEVEPTAAKLNGGWQIITIDLDGEPVDGFGYGKYTDPGSTGFGGQCYGEILLFKTELTDAQRYCVERSLAQKWGITYKGTLPATLGAAVVEGGSGVVRVPEDSAAALSGLYSGVLEVHGAVKIDGRLPPSADDVPAENRLDWYDAEDGGSVCQTEYEINSDLKLKVQNAVIGWLPRGKTPADMKVDDLYFYGSQDRMPYYVSRSNGLTNPRMWLDFNHPQDHKTKASDGNVIRCRPWNGSAASPKSTDTSRAIKQAFMALDSSRCGGLPISSSVGGTSAPFYRRASATDLATETPIWSANCGAQVRSAATRLNGVEVVGTATGFTGESEVLSFTMSESASFGFFEAYPNTEGGMQKGAIIGEVIFYTEPISGEAAAKVEAYLLGKWTGSLPDGYADYRGATVTGDGLLEVADLAAMPKIGAGFSGSLKVSAGTAWGQTVTIDPVTGTVSGALNCAGATFDLPADATCTLTVNFTSKPKGACHCTIVDCAANVNNTAFNVVLGDNVPKCAKLVRSDNKIELAVDPLGFMMVFR